MLNELVNKFLEGNGISIRFFALKINCEYTKCTRWLKGEKVYLNKEQLKTVHEFLAGKYLKTLEEIVSEGKGE